MASGHKRVVKSAASRLTLTVVVELLNAALAASTVRVILPTLLFPCAIFNCNCNYYLDYFEVFLYSINHLFPDCVMVALQILVLTVGVRILLGEIKKRS